jgi:hypothetical protein
MISITPTVDQVAMEETRVMLRSLGGGENGLREMNDMLGRAARNSVREHLRALNLSTPTPLGATKSNYYGRAAQGTSFWREAGGILVNIHTPGMALHYYGGTVTPGANISSATGQPTKYLSLPYAAEAYGHSPSEFPDLVMLWGKNGPYALAYKELTTGQQRTLKRRGASPAALKGTGAIVFLLVKSVTIGANPGVLPSDEQLTEDLQVALDAYTDRLQHRQQEPPETENNQTP